MKTQSIEYQRETRNWYMIKYEMINTHTCEPIGHKKRIMQNSVPFGATQINITKMHQDISHVLFNMK
jgi:ectoine hydroxylase-related dioxygenase (phytanoyl-CoA dioxygenase family)